MTSCNHNNNHNNDRLRKTSYNCTIVPGRDRERACVCSCCNCDILKVSFKTGISRTSFYCEKLRRRLKTHNRRENNGEGQGKVFFFFIMENPEIPRFCVCVLYLFEAGLLLRLLLLLRVKRRRRKEYRTR